MSRYGRRLVYLALPATCVTAGESFLIALPRNAYVDASGARRRTGFGNTFYPGAASFAEAKSVRRVVKAVRHHGADITDKPIEFVQGQDVAGLEVVVTRGSGGGRPRCAC